MLALRRSTGVLPGRLLTGTRAFAIEQGTRQTDAGPQAAENPVVEEDNLSDRRKLRESYEEIKAQRSGTAEDVRAKDMAPTSLGKMRADPTEVEAEYVEPLKRSVPSHRELEKDSQEVADAVFGGEAKDDAAALGESESTGKGVESKPGYSTPPQ